jgi:hypothetical protein
MNKLLRCGALTLLLCLPAQALAWQPHLRVKVDAGINFRCNVYFADDPRNNLAPWYTYWPVEAAYPPPPQPGAGNFFPNWPANWPPDQKNPDAPKGAATGALPPFVPVPPQTTWQPSGDTAQPYTFQPVGFFTQTPGYWYGK